MSFLSSKQSRNQSKLKQKYLKKICPPFPNDDVMEKHHFGIFISVCSCTSVPYWASWVLS
jgi:hypothetical protein